MTEQALGPIVYSFFTDHLQVQRGLRPTSVRSYRDALRLFLHFAAAQGGRKITRLTFQDLTFDRVLAFLRYLEEERHNAAPTRNQRLAALHAFFEYLANRCPELLAVAQQVAAIPTKRAVVPEARYLDHDEVESLFLSLPKRGQHASRDRALLLFLYNTGARVQEAADLRFDALEIDTPHPRVRLHGKGDKWRVCPLWTETATQLRSLRDAARARAGDPVFASRPGAPLTRFGIYKVVRRHASPLDTPQDHRVPRRVSPHVFRHTTAVHLLEAGVEANVIRGWLGHASLETTNRYAEITARTKEEALRRCEAPIEASAGFPRAPVWRNDESLLRWLESL